MIQRTPTSSQVYKSAVVQLESKSEAKQATITLQAASKHPQPGAHQNNRYAKNADLSAATQMSDSKQHVMQQLSSKQIPKQFELNLKAAREQTMAEQSPLRNAQPASFRFGKDKSPPATLPIQ